MKDEDRDVFRLWGLPLRAWTLEQTVDRVERLILDGTPSFFVTANLHYAMLTSRDPRLQPVNDRAAFVVADGMPLVWASRWRGAPLPERVTGADLVPALCRRAASRGFRVFFLGGSPNVARAAADRLCLMYPALRVAGVEAPDLDRLTPFEHAQLIARIRATRPQLLFAALGQPKGELWLLENVRALHVPVCAQIGASLDFVIERERRAPKWLQRLGLEWLHRALEQPRRLVPRYARNLLFGLRMMVSDARS